MRRARKTPLSGNASLSEWRFPLSECHWGGAGLRGGTRSTAKYSSALEGVGNAAPGERTGAALLAVVVTGGGRTVSPAWCRPESKGTAPGAGAGSTGCSQNEDVPPSEGVTVASVAAGCAAVVPETVPGRSIHPRRRPPASAPVAAEKEGPGRLDAGGGPGTSVACTNPPAGSGNAGLTVTTMGCGGTEISNRSGGATAVDATVTGEPAVTGGRGVARVAGMIGVVWVNRASSAPYFLVSLSNCLIVYWLMCSRA